MLCFTLWSVLVMNIRYRSIITSFLHACTCVAMYYADTSVGFFSAVDKMLMQAAKVDTSPER